MCADTADCLTAAVKPGAVLEDWPLAALTSWRIGGNARRLYVPSSIEQWSAMLKEAGPQVTSLGLGSNVLIADKGYAGSVFLTLPGLQTLRWHSPHRLYAQAGVTCSKIARFSQCQAMSFFAGIPGTVGGALAMNAGAFGGQTWDFVHSVEFLDPQGGLHHLSPADFQVDYRCVRFPLEGWFVGVVFDTARMQTASSEPIAALLRKRKESQPIGKRTCGSVFKNPPGDHAARLIQACGLKGHQIGQAQVSLKHANFIENLGKASASEVLALMELIEDQVEKEFNIGLEREVRLLGDF